MIKKYKQRANLAIGLSIGSIVILWMMDEVFKVGLSLEVYLVGLLFHFSLLLLGFWNYTKAKGYAGILGILALPFSLLGLIILAGLRDKNPEQISDEGKSRLLSQKINTPLVIFILILIILVTVVILCRGALR